MTEDEKNARFDIFVDQFAQQQGKRFFVKDGDGREFETEEMSGEDLFGWLIPVERESEFMIVFSDRDPQHKFDEFLCFANWKLSGDQVEIEFTKN